MITCIKDLLEEAKKGQTMRLVVAAAQDPDVLGAVAEAKKQGIVDPILVGDIEAIKKIIDDQSLDLHDAKMIEAKELQDAARTSVKLVSSNEADFLMKGLIDTSILLKAVLDKEIGLRTDSQLSHVMMYELPTYHKLLFLSDGGMNITPDLEAKKKIVANAITAAQAMGIDNVKVAALAAKEKVNPKMPATVDARALQEACEAGEFGINCTVEGPLAFDLAISKEAAEIKGFKSQIAGDSDVLIVPTIEMGNGIGKTLTYFANAKSAGVIMGAKVPVVLVSRADDYEAKLYSIAMGSVIASK